DMEEMKISMHVNSAILTAVVLVDSSKGGESFKNKYRVTNFWIFEEGSWRRAGFHDGKIE
ncbi:MAG: hypothetical protein AAFU67_17105, partial [Bacteroidota bacterium]